MLIFINYNKWLISLWSCLLFFVLTGSAQAFVGSSFGSSNLQVNNGENLIWGNISDTSSGSASFVLFQEVAGGATYLDRFRVDHSGNVYVGGQLCFGSYGSTNCSNTWGISNLPDGNINQTLRYNGTGWEASNILINNNTNIGINTNSPVYRLDVNGQMRLQPSTQPTANRGVIYFDSTTNKFRCSEDGTSFVDCISSGGSLPGGSVNQTLRYNGTTWVASNLLYNNNTNIGIGTTAPGQKLDVAGSIKLSEDIYTVDNKSIRVDAARGTNFYIGNYADGSGFGYNTTYKTNLSVEGDIAGDRLCIEADCRDSWPSGLSGAGTANYVAKFNDTTTLGDSQIFDNGTNVGIGVAAPTSKLEIDGNVTLYSELPADRMIISSPRTNLFVRAGNGALSRGGNLNLLSGDGSGGMGGDILITAGAGRNALFAADHNGGNVKINPGQKNDNGLDGDIYINNLRGNAYMGRVSSDFSLTVLGNESITGRLGINTNSPAYRLDVNGQMRLQPSSQPTPVKGVIYFDSNANKFRCSEDGTSFVDCIGSGGTPATLPTGAINQTLRHDGTTWVASNLLYNNNTNIGIGTNAPTIKLAVGDSDTGLHWISDGNLAIYTNNVERVRFNSAGNIGIGTIAPGQKLDVAGNIRLFGDLYVSNNKSIRVDNATANTTILVGNYGDNGSFVYGTTPSVNLAVEGDVAGDRLCIENDCRDSWSAIGNLPSGVTNETLRYSGTDWVSSGVLVNNGTNVGIGTNSPTEKLDVSGNIKGNIIQSVTGTNQGVVEMGGRARISSPWTTGESLHIRTAQGLAGGTGQIKFFFGGTNDMEGAGVEQRYFMTANEFRPTINGGVSLGNSSFRWGNIYSNGTIDTSGNVNITGSGNNYFAGNIGIGVASPATKLDVNGQIKISGGSPGLNKILTSDTVGLATWKTASELGLAGGLVGTGSTNYVAKFIGAGALGDSQIVDNGTNVGVGISNPNYTLHVNQKTSGTGVYIQLSNVASGSATTDGLLLGVDASGNTAIINREASNLRFLTSNTERMIISGSGDVGVGISTPLAKTHIRSDVVGKPALMLANSSYDIVWGTNETYRLGEWDGTTFTERMSILDAGQVGIGLTAPVQALEIGDTAIGVARIRITDTNDNPELQLQYGTGDAHWGIYSNQTSANSFNIWSYNGGLSGDRLTILQSGNVGIGITTPAAKLDINGSLRVRGISSNTTNSRIMTTDSSGNVTYRDPGSWAIGTTLYSCPFHSLPNDCSMSSTGQPCYGQVSTNNRCYYMVSSYGVCAEYNDSCSLL